MTGSSSPRHGWRRASACSRHRLGGGALGLLFTVWATRFLLGLDIVGRLSLSLDLGVDVRVFGFTFAISLVTGLAFGLLPALRASRPELVAALKDADAPTGSGRGVSMRDVLVVAQIAVSLLLLVGAALLGRSLQGAQAIDVGFDADHTALIEMQLAMIGYGDEQADVFQRQYLERVRGLPGVEAAALTQRLPLTASVSVTGVFLPGVHDSPDDDGYVADEAVTGPGYLETLGVPLLAGRDFSEQDTPETPLVAIVNQTMAEAYWPGVPALGKKFRTGFDGDEYEIVGIVGDHKVRTVGEEPRPYVHFARTQRRSTYAMVVARAAGDPVQLAVALRDELRATEPDLGPGGSTVRESVEASLLPVTLGAKMLAGFGLLALALASVGLYGVIAYSGSRRGREIGIRMALGADRPGVVKLVVRRGMALAAVGVVIGGLAATVLSGLLSSVLYGIGARDPLAFGGAATLLLVVALVANYLPAHRAAHVDPLVALRSD